MNTDNHNHTPIKSASAQPANAWLATASETVTTTALATFSAAVAAGAATLAYAAFIEPSSITLEQLTLRIPNAQGRIPATGLRILHLSDSHFQGRGWRETPKIRRIQQLVQGLEYDLLIHTGDFIHYDHGLPNALALLNVLPAPKLGKFAVLGNHDYAYYSMQTALPRMWHSFRKRETSRGIPAWQTPLRLPHFVKYVRNTPLDGRRSGYNDAIELADQLGAHGFQLLHNRALHLIAPQQGIDLYLAGVDDVTEGRPRLGATLTDVPEDAPLLLLSHNPDILASPQIGRVDLVLAGHTHGGQIVVPVWGPAHTQSWHLERKEVAGYMRRGRTHIYITRGIGEGIPLRFNAPPQIALITLLPE